MRQGIHPKVVQERLGHSAISITLDVYSHVVPGLQEHAATAFADAMRPTVLSNVGKMLANGGAGGGI